MDAGIASEESIAWLGERGCDRISVSRGAGSALPYGGPEALPVNSAHVEECVRRPAAENRQARLHIVIHGQRKGEAPKSFPATGTTTSSLSSRMGPAQARRNMCTGLRRPAQSSRVGSTLCCVTWNSRRTNSRSLFGPVTLRLRRSHRPILRNTTQWSSREPSVKSRPLRGEDRKLIGPGRRRRLARYLSTDLSDRFVR